MKARALTGCEKARADPHRVGSFSVSEGGKAAKLRLRREREKIWQAGVRDFGKKSGGRVKVGS